MTDLKSELLAADKGSFEDNGEEKSFYYYGSRSRGGGSGEEGTEEAGFGTPPPTQTWLPFEDLDDSGHFTASPDGEKALSGSSRSHSPCLSSTHILLQMQQNNSSVADSQHSAQTQLSPSQSQSYQSMQSSNPKEKSLISPRSVMTVKVPQGNTPSLVPSASSNNIRQEGSSSDDRPVTYTLQSFGGGKSASAQNPRTSNNSTLQFSHMLQQSSLLPSGGDGDHGPGGDSSDVPCDYLRQILKNFNSLYVEKLKMIDNLVVEGNMNEKEQKIMMEKKTNILENWAKDSCLQNMALIHTVEELEKEAGGKVAALQKKMTESAQVAKEHMMMMKKYEEQVKLLMDNYNDCKELNSVLEMELEILKKECRRERERMNWLLKDNDALLTLVCRIRDMGVWDISGLEFQRTSFDQIFGLYPSLMGAEVQTVFTREKANQVKETEAKVTKLEKELESVKQSHREAETSLLDRNKKIQELEIEIKNVVNKAHYSEKECNEYKKSLLETQEKLLEATRRLTSFSQQSYATVKGTGENEMTELIKELRQVKSQLNTAIEEKHVAKEESISFKTELSERLKEMHDIQTAFQSLATEVVTSRSAFQQVQEMEVQLQALKAEIQTYQSRCSNADDTILKKDKEIKKLQQQMNDIHRRNKKKSVSSPRSRIPVIQSNKPKSIKSPRKYANIIPTWDVPPPQPQQDNRPPWNIHFKKSTGILSRPPAELPPVPKLSRVFTESLSTKSQSSLTRASLTNADIMDTYEKVPSTNSKLLKLPKIENRDGIRKETSVPLTATAENRMKGEKLPIVQDTSRISKERKPEQKSRTYFKRLNPDESTPATPRITELITAVVETSKKLMEQSNSNERLKTHKHREARDISVTAAHYRRHRKRDGGDPEGKLRRTKSIDKNMDRNKSAETKSSTLSNVIAKFHSLTEVAAHKKDHRESSPDEDHESKGESMEVVYQSPPNVKEYLSNLPEESIEDLVSSWIKKSPSSDSVVEGKKKQRVAKSMPVAGRQSSVRVMKHLATRRCLKQSNANSKSNKSSESAEEAEMFELEQEWGKVFANLEHKKENTNFVERTEAENSSQQAGNEENFNKHTSKNLPSHVFLSEIATSVESEVVHNTAPLVPVENPNETKCQQEMDSLRELLNRLTKEKQETEDRLKRELQEKDIELKMQKVTIQHLQDAYVALKRGQPIPVPQNATGNKISANGSNNVNNHQHKLNNNNNILDV